MKQKSRKSLQKLENYLLQTFVLRPQQHLRIAKGDNFRQSVSPLKLKKANFSPPQGSLLCS